MEFSISPDQKKKILLLLVFIIPLYLFISVLSASLGFIFIFTLVWLKPRKDQKIFINRFKDYKNYKLRILTSLILVFISIKIGIFNYQIERQRNYLELQRNYPVPEIKILSSFGNQGEVENYLLEFSVSDYSRVTVNSKELESENGNFKINIPLESIGTNIEILAVNDYKKSKDAFTIYRNETESEKTIRLAKEEEEKLKAEEAEKTRLAEVEKQKEIQAEELREYQEIQKNRAIADKNKAIANIQSELDNIRSFTGGKHYESIEGLNLEIAVFASWLDIINNGKNSEYKEVQDLAKQLEQGLISLQIREFPKMRKAYGEIAGKELWRHDVEVKVFGTANGTIEFVGYHFSLNANIEDTHKELKDMLTQLRFDRANYKFSEYGEYTYYTLKSKKDSEI